MHIRDQRNSNNFHGYKNIWLIINSKFIRSQKTHRKKSYIVWISKRPLYWESNEAGIHLATNYGPVGLQRTTHASSERHQWRWCLDWIWWFWTLRRLDEYFVDSPRVFGNIWVFIEQRGGPGALEVGRTHKGAPGPPNAPWWVVPPSGHPPGATRAQHLPFGP